MTYAAQRATSVGWRIRMDASCLFKEASYLAPPQQLLRADVVEWILSDDLLLKFNLANLTGSQWLARCGFIAAGEAITVLSLSNL